MKLELVDFLAFAEGLKQARTIAYVSGIPAALAVEKMAVLAKVSCLSTRWLNSEAFLSAFNQVNPPMGILGVVVLPRLTHDVKFKVDSLVWCAPMPAQRDNYHPTFISAMQRGLSDLTRRLHLPIIG